MHTLRNRIVFFGSTALAGLASLVLHRYMMENCLDAKGLLIPWNLPSILLWVVGIGFAVCLGAMVTTIGGDGTYADNFPRCLFSGSMMLAAGAVLACSVSQLGLEADGYGTVTIVSTTLLAQLGRLAGKLLPWLAAVCMAVLGLYRMAGKRPPCILSGVVCLFYMLMLVTNYRLWSADPQLQDYAYQLLAGVLLMLCSFHRTCCDAGIIQRRKLLATGLSAAVCCAASLSGDFMPGFYLASGLWAVGSMCNVATLPPDPEEAETPAETQPEQPEPDAEP